MATVTAERLSANLSGLIRQLEAHTERLRLEHLQEMVTTAELSPRDVADFIRFDDESYQDHLVWRSHHFEVRCLCWKKGQHTSIHDHHGSSCVVRVLQGTLTNRDFAPAADGRVRLLATSRLQPGQLNARQDHEIHQLSNDGDADVVSLHVYSPPLGGSHLFRLAPGQSR